MSLNHDLIGPSSQSFSLVRDASLEKELTISDLWGWCSGDARPFY